MEVMSAAQAIPISPARSSACVSIATLAVILLTLFSQPAEAQWEIQSAPTTADLRGIHNVGNGIAWASGTEGTVLRTTNDGKDWQRCTAPPDAEHLDFRGIQAFDAATAIVMSSGKGPLSRLYKTTDACQTWHLVLSNPDPEGFWDALIFDERMPVNPSSDWRTPAWGFLVGDPVNGAFAISLTEDSGDTWHAWSLLKDMRPAKSQSGEAIFAASNSSLVVPGINGMFAFATGGVAGSRLFIDQGHSPFDGAEWRAFNTLNLLMPKGSSSGAFSIAANRSSGPLSPDLMIVGGDYEKSEHGAAIFIPHRNIRNGLFSYHVIPSVNPPHGYRSAVAYDAATKTWITVGPNGTDISTDDGRNWRALRPNPALLGPNDIIPEDQHWNALSLPFVVGPHGRIGKLRPNALTSPAKGAKP